MTIQFYNFTLHILIIYFQYNTNLVLLILFQAVLHSVHEEHLMFNVCLCYTLATVKQKMITLCTK
jgi:hypothetical protein